jgi:uncharacterized membrane protein
VRLGQRILARTPLVKSICNAINDCVSYFSRRPAEDASTVVSVRLFDEISVMGFVTDPHPVRMSGEGEGEDRMAVYLPMSYQIGGYTLLVPRDRITPLALGAEEAMRLVLTAGVTSRSAQAKP